MASPDDVICAFSDIFLMYDLISAAFYDKSVKKANFGPLLRCCISANIL